MSNYNNNNRRDSGNSRSQHQMHDATCGDCGNNCKVPFMPNSDRPVYCSDCFEQRGNGKGDSRNSSYSNNDRYSNNRNHSDNRNYSDSNRKPKTDFNKRFDEVNQKLDSILRMLEK